jgi:hypothetical protein
VYAESFVNPGIVFVELVLPVLEQNIVKVSFEGSPESFIQHPYRIMLGYPMWWAILPNVRA